MKKEDIWHSARSGNFDRIEKKTRRERLKSALYLRLKKRKAFKIAKGGPFGLFETSVGCKISKNLKEGHFADKKIQKVAQCRKKFQRGAL